MRKIQPELTEEQRRACEEVVRVFELYYGSVLVNAREWKPTTVETKHTSKLD